MYGLVVRCCWACQLRAARQKRCCCGYSTRLSETPREEKGCRCLPAACCCYTYKKNKRPPKCPGCSAPWGGRLQHRVRATRCTHGRGKKPQKRDRDKKNSPEDTRACSIQGRALESNELDLIVSKLNPRLVSSFAEPTTVASRVSCVMSTSCRTFVRMTLRLLKTKLKRISALLLA